MKRLVVFLFTASTITTFLSSCSKFLDVKPKGYTIPQFYEDYAKLMNSQDLIRVSAAYPNYLTDDVQVGEPNDVIKQASYTGLSDYKKNLYGFAHNGVFVPGTSDPLWEGAYSHIYTYNIIVNNIMNVPDASELEKKQLKAEALFGRAFEYLTLVNAYSKQYNAATAGSDYGVPVILTEDINAPYKRNTVAEVYDRIKADLEAAVQDLPTKSKNVFHPTKSVGYSFLSRMYLYMGKYPEALSNAKSALAINSNLIDYTLYRTIKGVTFGRVCLISDTAQRFPDANLSSESVWVRFANGSSSSVNAEVYVSNDLLSVFGKDLPADAVDQRRNLFFCNGEATFGVKTVYFPGRSLYAPYIDFNLGLSTAEIMLIAAECEARVGSKDEALKLVNALRDKRIKNNQALTAATNEDALKLVLDERRREFCLIATYRLVDLKRLNTDPRFAKTITHTQGANSTTLPANDNRYILPVPPKVLEFSSGIPQYER
ncbi:RagB/SusD family nutrient uptake outer membrane protein [Chitinophaga eiseniae]|uniref:RagB/SusD family nutrient uptake outer membrane protein n=1 Tax=Chitinophaga eiseniae TaxID=634771 RepID=A0A847SB33_9BACT|nr:RagB/SusD family nutrient uptake outer membrane protein [Chitinophaga eiseniae]NLR77304.1 RagB/SusD family nutrient uptake outer membrane protein [Chitinophaga eiseniae]